MMLLVWLGVAAVSTAVVWKGSGILESASEQLAAYYQLPPVVQGAVIAAVGSSFPELSTTVISTLIHGEFELGVSAIVGSAIFNILVIPGVSGLVTDRLASDRTLVYKDAQFYITSVAVLLIAFSFALIYNPVEGSRWEGTMTRPIALIPFLLYGVYLFLQQQDTAEHQLEADADPTDVQPGKAWGRLAVSLVIIVAGVEGLVRAAIGFGEVFGTPSFIWGLTVIAAGTSLPDAFVSINAARRGEGVISIANVLGSNIFDLLVAVPAGVLIAGAAPVDFSVAAPMMGVLTLATIVLFAMLRTKLRLSRRECYVLLGLYAAFVAWLILETVEVTHVLA